MPAPKSSIQPVPLHSLQPLPPQDATHSPMFHQMEGLVVDKKITLCDLKGMLDLFVKKIFGEETTTRLRPSYPPFPL